MESTSAIAKRLADLRTARHLSLGDLAERSGVSKSMISKIERGQTNPSAAVLGRLAEALGVGISDLIGAHDQHEIIVLRKGEQLAFREEQSGFVRRAVSPVFPNRGIDVVFNTLPPGASTGLFGGHRRGVEEYIAVVKGRIRAHLGDRSFDLDAGDSLYFQADVDHRFDNLARGESAWFLVIDSSRLRER